MDEKLQELINYLEEEDITDAFLLRVLKEPAVNGRKFHGGHIVFDEEDKTESNKLNGPRKNGHNQSKEDKMSNYTISRVGSNAANQSMIDCAVVCRVEAKNRDAAVEKALVLEKEGRFTLYANQHLEALPTSRVPYSELEDLEIEEQMESVVGCAVCGKLAPEPMPRWQANQYYCGCAD